MMSLSIDRQNTRHQIYEVHIFSIRSLDNLLTLYDTVKWQFDFDEKVMIGTGLHAENLSTDSHSLFALNWI